ncbi:hypothetical protein C8Q78DRAFT_1063624 [Trametes maxima]|nr:hypothetical protein C8Q78DRAFT_1063624 [Trametes maxima]
MGLFGIHMPILYGEGRKAFLRLQQTILSEVCDHTLFAWGSAMGAITSTAGGVLRDKGLNKFHGGTQGPPHSLHQMTSVNMDEFVATTRALCKNDKVCSLHPS